MYLRDFRNSAFSFAIFAPLRLRNKIPSSAGISNRKEAKYAESHCTCDTWIIWLKFMYLRDFRNSAFSFAIFAPLRLRIKNPLSFHQGDTQQNPEVLTLYFSYFKCSCANDYGNPVIAGTIAIAGDALALNKSA
jgi:hypothetical protein